MNYIQHSRRRRYQLASDKPKQVVTVLCVASGVLAVSLAAGWILGELTKTTQ